MLFRSGAPGRGRRVSTASAAGPRLVLGFWLPVCLPGELARSSSFSSSTFRNGAESASLLPFSKLDRIVQTGGEGSRSRLKSGVRGTFCAGSSSSVPWNFLQRRKCSAPALSSTVNRSPPAAPDGLKCRATEECNFNLVLHGRRVAAKMDSECLRSVCGPELSQLLGRFCRGQTLHCWALCFGTPLCPTLRPHGLQPAGHLCP